MPTADPSPRTGRAAIRHHIRSARLARPETVRQADDRARDRRVLALLDDLLPATEEAVVACYLSYEAEPGTLELVGTLSQAHSVLVPKLTGKPRDLGLRHPDWAWFTDADDLVPGPLGIPEPAGPSLGPEALGMAQAVIASALQAGPDGGRLGTGGGWFDRALLHLTPGTQVIALLNDDEVVHVPQLPHDRPVNWLVTPTRTIPVDV